MIQSKQKYKYLEIVDQSNFGFVLKSSSSSSFIRLYICSKQCTKQYSNNLWN